MVRCCCWIWMTLHLLLLPPPSRAFPLVVVSSWRHHRTPTVTVRRRMNFGGWPTNNNIIMPNNNNDNNDSPSRPTKILMILSPAKTLDLTSPLPPWLLESNLPLTQPDCCLEKTQAIATYMKGLSLSALTKLLQVSASLGQTAAEYWRNFRVLDNHTDDDDKSTTTTVLVQTKPCIYTYSGAAYQGLDIYNHDMTRDEIRYLQHHLRVLSAVYGLLRPLDPIQPYRLEMGTALPLLLTPDDAKQQQPIKLARYWSEAVTNRLAEELRQDSSDDNDNPPIVLNLASDEYAAAVDMTQLSLSCRCIKVIFQESQGRVVAVHAKRARGRLVRYMALQAIDTVGGIRAFDGEGYQFVESLSNETTLVFRRTAAAPKKKRAAATTTTKSSAIKTSSSKGKKSKS